MKFILSMLGVVGSFFMIYYRETIGDMMGEAEWMRAVGGVHVIVVLIAIFIFFWSLAEMTNTKELLFTPILWLFPGSGGAPTGADTPF